MADPRVEKWQKAKGAVIKAQKWNDLPKGEKYQNDKFDISIAHCKAPTLNRMGQQYSGGTSYWETDPEFNQAILEYLVTTWHIHYPAIIDILQKKELNALTECQSYVDEMQDLINGTIKE